MISAPVAFHTPAWAQMWSSTSSRCRMRQGWPMIHGCRCTTISRPVVAPSAYSPSNHSRHSRLTSLIVPAVQVDVVVVEISIDAERIELAGFRRHAVGLLIIAPVADIANALGGEQVWGIRRLLEIRAAPADRSCPSGPFDGIDRGADVITFFGFRHADMD